MDIKAIYGAKLDLPKDNIFVLSLISKGNCIIEINNSTYCIEAPAVLCLDERKRTKVISSTCLDVKTIYFNPVFINRNMTIELIRSNDYPYLIEEQNFFQLTPFLEQNDSYHSFFTLDNSIFTKLSEIVDKCKEELETQIDLLWSCRTRSYFMEVLMHLERIYHNYSIDHKNDSNSFKKISQEFSQILFYLDSNLNNAITIAEISKKYMINKTSLQNWFKDEVSMTFYDYISKRRIECAANMLRFTELSLDEISIRTGFSSTQNFCKFFKKNVGMPPDKFRKSVVEYRIEWQNGKAILKS